MNDTVAVSNLRYALDTGGSSGIEAFRRHAPSFAFDLVDGGIAAAAR